VEYTTRLTIGCCVLSLLAREIVGSFTSRGMPARICATLSRISCATTTTSASMRTSTDMNVKPSRAVA
jgi:hypothetical protein